MRLSSYVHAGVVGLTRPLKDLEDAARLPVLRGRRPAQELPHGRSTRTLQQADKCGSNESFVSCNAPTLCEVGNGCLAEGRQICEHAKDECQIRGGMCNITANWMSLDIPKAGIVVCRFGDCNAQGPSPCTAAAMSPLAPPPRPSAEAASGGFNSSGNVGFSGHCHKCDWTCPGACIDQIIPIPALYDCVGQGANPCKPHPK